MEDYPLEAITNNVFGTEVMVDAAASGGVRKFVLISTDKAVAPVGVMGLTKRVAEGLLLARGGLRTTYAAVRFGNVLGSDGSVLPLFRWQMASQRSVTVTHEEATRYFMLISEAPALPNGTAESTGSRRRAEGARRTLLRRGRRRSAPIGGPSKYLLRGSRRLCNPWE
jgi:FlaA1/EpsC-like NDP-sugar epimerase